MRLTRMQIRNQIRSLLRESVAGNPIAGFGLEANSAYTNAELKALGVDEAWWWAQAAATGLWMAEEELEAKLTQKFEALTESFDEEIEGSRPKQGKVQAGEPEIETRRQRRRARKGKSGDTGAAASPARSAEKSSLTFVTAMRAGGDKVDAALNVSTYGNQFFFANLADRLLIQKRLAGLNKGKSAEFKKIIEKDIADIVDKDSGDGYGDNRYQTLYNELNAKVREIMGDIKTINDDVNKKINDGIAKKDGNIVIKAGEDAGGISGVNIPEEEVKGYVWTEKGKSGPNDYVYIKSDDPQGFGWKFAKKKDYDKNKSLSVFKKINLGGANNLEKFLKNGTLRGNPLESDSLKESRNLNRMQIRRLVESIVYNLK